MLWHFPYSTILWMILSFPAFWCFLIFWFTSSVRHSTFAQSRKFKNGPKRGNITRALQKLSGIWDGFSLSNVTLGYMPSPNTAKAKQSAHTLTDNTGTHSCTSTNPWRPSWESWIYCWLGSRLCTRKLKSRPTNGSGETWHMFQTLKEGSSNDAHQLKYFTDSVNVM